MEVHAQMQNSLNENALLRHGGAPAGRPAEGETQPPSSEHEPVTLEEAQRSHVLRTLESTHWVIEGSHGAAALLKLPPSTLRSLMKRLGVRRVPRQQPPQPLPQ
jgi:transcriptional regulator with GAF, ATPase, and Fis domain